MKIEYLKLDDFDDLTKYKEEYEKIYGEIGWEEFPKELFSKKPHVYTNYKRDEKTYVDNVVNIAFVIKKLNDTIYVIHNGTDFGEEYMNKFKKKLEEYKYDSLNFDNISSEELAKLYVSGQYELIIS